jgi:hypothetical protein
MPWAGVQQLLIAAGAIAATLVTHVTPGSFTETIPAGAQNCVIELWGPSNAGGNGSGAGCGANGGGGGGAGGYCRTSLNVTPGLTFNYTVGAPDAANSTVTSGTQAVTTMTANGGTVGGNAAGGGAGGPGGTATGGTVVNTTGGTGNVGGLGGPGGTGGGQVAGLHANLGGQGGHGGSGAINTGRTDGQPGGVAFFYT